MPRIEPLYLDHSPCSLVLILTGLFLFLLVVKFGSLPHHLEGSDETQLAGILAKFEPGTSRLQSNAAAPGTVTLTYVVDSGEHLGPWQWWCRRNSFISSRPIVDEFQLTCWAEVYWWVVRCTWDQRKVADEVYRLFVFDRNSMFPPQGWPGDTDLPHSVR